MSRYRPAAPVPPWSGFNFNPEGANAWREAVRRSRHGYGDALGTMLLRPGPIDAAARAALLDAARKDPKPARRPALADATTTSWSVAIRLHEGGNREAVPALLAGHGQLPAVARRFLAALAVRAPRRLRKAARELGSLAYTEALYSNRRSVAPIVWEYAEQVEHERANPPPGRDTTPDARAIEAVADRLKVSEAAVRRAVRPEKRSRRK